MDVQPQLLLLSGDDLPRLARADGLSRAWNSRQQPDRAACDAEGDTGAGGDGGGIIRGRPFIVGNSLTMADFFLLPTLFGFSLTPEGKRLLPKFPAVQAWAERMAALPSVIRFRASLPPRAPIPHAREWVHHHRPAA